MKTLIEIYPKPVRGKRQWFWRGKRKGRKVIDGAESYKNRVDLLRVLKNIVTGGFTLPKE